MQLFVLITSFQSSPYRDELRKTWIRDLKDRNIPYLFVVGGNETKIEQDVLTVCCGDQYQDCPMKQRLSIQHVLENNGFDYLFCCDDDNYVVVERLLDSGFESHDYFGGGPIDKWEDAAPYVQGGAGIFLSRKAAQLISEYPLEGDCLTDSPYSDMMVGKIMDLHGIQPSFDHNFRMGHEEDGYIRPDARFNRIISAHKIALEEIQKTSIEMNPFRMFERVFLVGTPTPEMQVHLENLKIDQMVEICESPKDAVRQSKNCNSENVLILTRYMTFAEGAEHRFRWMVEEVSDWDVMILGGDITSCEEYTEFTVRALGINNFSGLAINHNLFDSFLSSGDLLPWVTENIPIAPKEPLAWQCSKYQPPLFSIKQNPVRVALVVNYFKRGGAEIEFNEMLTRLDPSKVQWTGLAVDNAHNFEISPKYIDQFPPVYISKEKTFTQNSRAVICGTFEEAILRATENADVIVKWHVNNPLVEALPQPSILLSNTFGPWTLDTYRSLRADLYVGNSDHSCKSFQNHEHLNTRTIYSGHCQERLITNLGRKGQRSEWGVQGPLAGYIGRLSLDKNLLTIIKAIKLLPEWGLVLVGQLESKSEDLEQLLERHIPGRYLVKPWQHSVGDILAAIDCFVLVSDYEGFSNALAEAWLMRTPSVYSLCGSVSELEEKYGSMGQSVHTGVKPALLASKIEASGEFPERVETAFKAISEFTLERSARAWEDAILEMGEMSDPLRCKAFYAYNKFDLSKRLRTMLDEHRPKKVARILNRENVPVPDGSPEWTYKSVEAFSLLQ